MEEVSGADPERGSILVVKTAGRYRYSRMTIYIHTYPKIPLRKMKLIGALNTHYSTSGGSSAPVALNQYV